MPVADTAVILAEPADTAVTMPFWSTVATPSSLLDHTTVSSIESEGVTEYIRTNVMPGAYVTVPLDRWMISGQIASQWA